MTLLERFAARRELWRSTAAACSLKRLCSRASLSLGGAKRLCGDAGAMEEGGTTRLICGERRRCADDDPELRRDTSSMAITVGSNG